MVSLTRKFILDKKERWLFLGLIIIAANAGGAWSPIGDVTTTMLWIGEQITSAKIITELFIPSLVCFIVPATILSFNIKGNINIPDNKFMVTSHHTTEFERRLVFFAGIGGLIFVPIFKSLTHLPPFMGMMLSLGFLWLLTDIIHKNDMKENRRYFSVFHAFFFYIYHFIGQNN